MSEALDRLLALMVRLRDSERGCPWDREQTFESIAPHTIEEAYEVADAVARKDLEGLREELGDLLFQVVFQARLGEECGAFDFDAVATTLHDKLVRRHPQVFGVAMSVDPAGVQSQWEALKAHERAARGATGALQGVPLALPALTRAAKIGRRAARVGFDWAAAAQVREKVSEELQEADTAVRHASGVDEEIGDLLLAVANWARHLKLDPEACLRTATAKFERRFAHMETIAAEQGLSLERLDSQRWDALWLEAKRLTGS